MVMTLNKTMDFLSAYTLAYNYIVLLLSLTVLQAPWQLRQRVVVGVQNDQADMVFYI